MTHPDEPMSDLNSGERLRLGTWNLDRDKPLWRQPFQADHICQEADLWLLTEVPASWKRVTARLSFSGSLPGETDQYWSAIKSKWPFEPIKAKHPSLAMARIKHPGGDFLAASSVFPWRGAAKFWPHRDGDSFAKRCAATVQAHADEIGRARNIGKPGRELPVVWGGDFNQALSGRDYVGSDAGRAALLEAFQGLGVRPVTAEAAGQDPVQRSIDHIAIPEDWSLWDLKVQRPQSEGRFLSDHPSYVAWVEQAASSGP